MSKIDLGVSKSDTPRLIDLWFSANPQPATLDAGVRVIARSWAASDAYGSGTLLTDTVVSTNLPAGTTFLRPELSIGAGGTAPAIQRIGFAGFFVMHARAYPLWV